MLLSYPKVQPPVVGTTLGTMWVVMMVLRQTTVHGRRSTVPLLWYKLVPVRYTTPAQRMKWAKDQMDLEPRCERVELLKIDATVVTLTQVAP